MNTSIFTVAGPIMIGPSSSHTAGAAKLGRVAKQIVGREFNKVEFYLHGSFEKTGKGHGTDRALLAGVMGICEDDERLPNSFEIAKERGIDFSFDSITLENSHENAVRIIFYMDNEKLSQIEGASIGGGEILITKINGYDVKIRGNLTTIFVRQNDKKGVISHIARILEGASIGGGEILITKINGYDVKIRGNLTTIFVRQNDKKGVISHIARILNDNDINIATMNVSRSAKAADAMCIVEVDGDISQEVAEALADYKEIKFVKIIKHL